MKGDVKSLDEMKSLAENFITSLKPREKSATVVGLYGDLGAGKTTFVQAVAKELGISKAVSSPTFVIMKIYELSEKKWKYLIHIDAYRLEKSLELLHVGWQ